MGQGWTIAAPSVGEVESCGGGKLGEDLFDGSPQLLVMRLAVPVLPADWVQDRILPKGCGNLDGQQPEEKMNQNDGLHFVGASYPKRKREDDGSKGREAKRNNTGAPSQVQTIADRTTLSSLPIEVFDLIVEELYIEDIFNLGLASRRLWSVVERHMQDYVVSFMGPWAGESIVCVGHDIVPGDYPLGMLTKDEENKIEQFVDEEGQPMTLLSLTETFAEIRPDVSLPMVLLDELEKCHTLSDHDRRQIRHKVWPKISDFYPRDRLWILRNLTTREYVRADAIALKPEHIHGPIIDHIGFGEVVLSRICWSTSSSGLAMTNVGNIHRGIWAGHRLDITTLERHREDTQEDVWRDVSEQAAKDLASIWESEYGSGWREDVMNRRVY